MKPGCLFSLNLICMVIILNLLRCQLMSWLCNGRPILWTILHHLAHWMVLMTFVYNNIFLCYYLYKFMMKKMKFLFSPEQLYVFQGHKEVKKIMFYNPKFFFMNIFLVNDLLKKYDIFHVYLSAFIFFRQWQINTV